MGDDPGKDGLTFIEALFSGSCGVALSERMGGGGDDACGATSQPPVWSTRWDSGGRIDSHRISVAPMLECTDTHFRRVCRLVSRRAHLWTEMVNQDAVVHSWRSKPEMLAYGDEEHPLTVQLGGASPRRLALAATVCDAEYRYDEINLNCGCPSQRVVNKKDVATCFGAALMRDPTHVGECLRRMREAVDVPVTVKHRLGVRPTEKSPDDSMDSYAFVSEFVDVVNQASGVKHFIVHARAAVLSGLSTTGNRTVPPLRHAEVHALADDFVSLGFTLNCGIETMDQAAEHLESWKLRGVMLGRAVYRNLGAGGGGREVHGDEPREAFRALRRRGVVAGGGTRMGLIHSRGRFGRGRLGWGSNDGGRSFGFPGLVLRAERYRHRRMCHQAGHAGEVRGVRRRGVRDERSRCREIPQRASHPAAARQGGARARPRREGRGRVSTRVRAGVWGVDATFKGRGAAGETVVF